MALGLMQENLLDDKSGTEMDGNLGDNTNEMKIFTLGAESQGVG